MKHKHLEYAARFHNTPVDFDKPKINEPLIYADNINFYNTSAGFTGVGNCDLTSFWLPV